MDGIHTNKLADTIAAHLERLILEGVLRPGEKLAAERELALKLAVSRPSLRDAINKLADRGLLKATRGGTYVAQFLSPLMKPLADLYRDNDGACADYFEFRRFVEAQAARAAALRATDVDKEAIRDCLTNMRKFHRLKDPAEESKADVQLHILIYEAGHNVVVLHVMRGLSELLRNNIFYNRDQLYGRPGVREKLLAQHIDIGEAVIAGDPDRSEGAADSHIRFVFGTVQEIQNDKRRLECSLLRVGRTDLLAE